MRFQFIHAADLHIDSPFAALGAKDAGVAATFAAAGRKAVEALIEETIASGARFLVIAGDVFDGDWKDVSTGLFFARQLGKLERAGVRTYLIKGNHDAENVMSRRLDYPPGVHLFETRKGQTALIEDLRVALHGRSFADRAVPADFLAGYAQPRKGWLNIGVLHTSLDGSAGHDPYAPCTVQDLARFGYDYWALGHIHAASVVSQEPWVVYPGNIQGRSPRETGPKGAMRVTVEDGRIVAVEPMILDAARWALARAELGGLEDEATIASAIDAALAAAHAQSDGRPLAVRLTLTGVTSAHARLMARAEEWRDEARALGFRLAEDCWVESLRVETSAPLAVVSHDPDALDVPGLLTATAQDPAFLTDIAELVASVAGKAPPGVLEALAARTTADWASRARDLLLGAR